MPLPSLGTRLREDFFLYAIVLLAFHALSVRTSPCRCLGHWRRLHRALDSLSSHNKVSVQILSFFLNWITCPFYYRTVRVLHSVRTSPLSDIRSVIIFSQCLVFAFCEQCPLKSRSFRFWWSPIYKFILSWMHFSASFKVKKDFLQSFVS